MLQLSIHYCCCCCLPKWGSPGPTSRRRGVYLWCTGPTRAPLKITHCQFLPLLFLSFIIKCFATRSSRSVSILSSLFYSCRAPLTPRSPIPCSHLFINLCRASLAQPNILLSHKMVVQKKIGKRRGPAEQVTRQTPQPNFDTTGLASPEVNTMGRRLNVVSQSAK